LEKLSYTLLVSMSSNLTPVASGLHAIGITPG
jgi:hypothetical protein